MRISRTLLAALALSVALAGSLFFATREHGVSAQRTAESAVDAPALESDTKALIAKVMPAYVLFPQGSGVCISEDGYALTNHHVFPEAARKYSADVNEKPVTISVQMSGTGQAFTARPVGADPRGDIVLVKLDIKPGQKLPFVNFADSDQLKVGDTLLAVGNPFLQAGFEFEPSVSLGVVSALNRYQGGYAGCIQTDAALNPGNSGGPAFNLKGELIGINGRILTNHSLRYNTGAGFAIPSNQVKRFVDAMLSALYGGATVVRHGLPSGLAMKHGPSAPTGAEVLEVRPESTAEKAGLRPGDRIVLADGKPVRTLLHWYNVTQAYPQGATIPLKVVRGDMKLSLEVTLDAPVAINQVLPLPRIDDDAEDAFVYQDVKNEGAGLSALPGMEAFNIFGVSPPTASVNAEVAKSPAGSSARGLAVENVNGDESALRNGDIITEVNGRKVYYTSDLTDVLLSRKSGETVPVTVVRAGKTLTVQQKLAKAEISTNWGSDIMRRLRGEGAGDEEEAPEEAPEDMPEGDRK